MDLDDLVDRAKGLAEDHQHELKETAVTDELKAAAGAAKEDLT